jgi:6-methylsalicylate decarboxylase
MAGKSTSNLSNPGRGASAKGGIDIHHHMMPPAWVAAERERMSRVAPNFPWIFEWTPEKSIEDMDRNGLDCAVLSISTVNADLPANVVRELVRGYNDYGARLTSDHSTRFGYFATIPLPDVDASLTEIEYAFNALKVDGIRVTTSYKDRWLGDPAFTPVLEELNRRKAVVFVHPTTPFGSATLLPEVQPPFLEYPFDTTRAITSLLFSGALSRFQNIKFIFSHGGGTIPFLAGRLKSMVAKRTDISERLPNGVLPELSRLFFDLTSSANRMSFAAIKELAGCSQMLLGSDFPYFSVRETIEDLDTLELSQSDERMLRNGNAAGLFPRLAN